MTLTKRSKHWHYRFRWRGQEYSGSTGLTSHRDAVEYERQLRHRDVRTTLRYVEVGLADLRDASERTWGGQIRHTDQADTA